MKRYYGSKQTLAEPVEKITLDDHVVSKKRIFFIALFLCLGFGAFAYAFTHLGGSEEGWQTVTIDKIADVSSSYDFTFLYEFGKGKTSARRERNSLVSEYRTLTERAYKVFDRRAEYAGIGNLCTVNRHPNEEVKVEPELYRALETCLKYDEKLLYLGALSESLDALITSDGAEALKEYDPYSDEAAMKFFLETAEHAGNGAVSLTLRGENKVFLYVSDEYMAFARENDIVDFIDFGWARNAVIADYLADELVKKGFTHGILQSYDGFIRNFCEGEEEFAYALTFAVNNAGHFHAGEMKYKGKKSIVWLHDYAANRAESDYRVLELSDGRKRHTYLGTDGLPKSALSDMLIWSENGSCAEISLQMAQYYISDSWQAEDAYETAGQLKIGLMTCSDGALICNDPAVSVPAPKSYGDIVFRLELRASE
ncbi:MAG: hypothetical protein J6P36_00905 [Lachnospiraceae bacterium]|nr:hypothetical protein [Lachnospiraceae bacterium]